MGLDTEGELLEFLTPRERDVLALLREGLSDRQIADRLALSPRTINRYVSEIIGKLGVRNRYEAASWPDPPPWWAGALAPLAILWRRAGAALPLKASSLATGLSGGALLVLAGGLGLIALLLGGAGGGAQRDLDAGRTFDVRAQVSGQGGGALPLPQRSTTPLPSGTEPPSAAPALPGSTAPTRPQPRDDPVTPERHDDGGRSQSADPTPEASLPSTPTPTPAPAGTGAMAIDCDASQPGIQGACVYPSGSTFAIQVHVLYAPADGYFGVQAKVAWNDAQLDYIPPQPLAPWGLWSRCDIPAQVQDTVAGAPSLLSGCVPFPMLREGATETGAVFEFGFSCVEDGRAPLRLIAAPGDAQLGSHFTDAALGRVEPALADADVTCGPCSTGDCPPPALSGLGRVAVDCDTTLDGVQDVCRYAGGESFSVQIHILDPPAGGFHVLTGYMRWDEAVFEYVRPAVSRSVDSCDFSQGYTGYTYLGGLIGFGCTTAWGFTLPPLNDFTGPFLEWQFRCGDGGVATAALEGFLDGSLGETRFSAGEEYFAPYLENATVTCE